MGGMTPKAPASVAATAAPVGVVSSTAGPARVDGLAREQCAVAGAGTGKHAVLGLHRSAADVERGADDGLDIQQIEGRASADDIGDRIDRADFVEVHLLDRDLVRSASASPRRWNTARRSLSRAPTNRPFRSSPRCAPSGGARAHGRVRCDRERVRRVPPPRVHAHRGRGTWWRRCRSALPSQTRRRRRRPLKQWRRRWRSGRRRIRQRADEHVAADPGECVQITGYGHRLLL